VSVKANNVSLHIKRLKHISRNAPQHRQFSRPVPAMLAVRTVESPSEYDQPISTLEPEDRSAHICTSCSRSFSRAEHLERHFSVHMSTMSSRSFACTYCTKGFTRKDVLTRHVRAVHETKRAEQRKSRRKSCNRCARFKIKCAGGSRGLEASGSAREPCDACKKRGLSCAYDFSVQKAEGSVETGSDDYRLSGSPSSSAQSQPSPPSSPEVDANSWRNTLGRVPEHRYGLSFGSPVVHSTPVEPSVQDRMSSSPATPSYGQHHHSISYIRLGGGEGFSDPHRYKANGMHYRELSRDFFLNTQMAFGLSTPETSPSQQVAFAPGAQVPPTPTSPHALGWKTGVLPAPDRQCLTLPPLRHILSMEGSTAR
jgi:hypothetical protein